MFVYTDNTHLYEVVANVRQLGALGKFEPITLTVDAENEEEARETFMALLSLGSKELNNIISVTLKQRRNPHLMLYRDVD